MSDPLQRTSSIPLPVHQTDEAAHDPLPLASSRAVVRDEAARLEPAVETKTRAFEIYLNETTFTVAERARKSVEADPAQDIFDRSAYGGLGQKSI